MKPSSDGKHFAMDQMEKSSVVRTRRYNDFPNTPTNQREKMVSEAVLTAPAEPAEARTKRIWFFEDGSGEMKDLLGGKGAGLAEMTRAGLPVPPGFTITTEVCLAFYEAGRRFPDGLQDEIRGRDARAGEAAEARASASPHDPLLVSVRSGARGLDAGHDGHDPQPGPQRRHRDRAWPS